jgi:antitoxin component YwqK of YwqJK toxin-antitoxin module
MDDYENGQIQFSGNVVNGKLDGEKRHMMKVEAFATLPKR